MTKIHQGNKSLKLREEYFLNLRIIILNQEILENISQSKKPPLAEQLFLFRSVRKSDFTANASKLIKTYFLDLRNIFLTQETTGKYFSEQQNLFS